MERIARGSEKEKRRETNFTHSTDREREKGRESREGVGKEEREDIETEREGHKVKRESKKAKQ